MRMRKSLVGLVALSLAAPALNAAIVMTAERLANSVDAGRDTVLLYARNDGSGAQGGTTGLSGLDLTISSSQLVVGWYRSGAAGNYRYWGDPAGSRSAIGADFDLYSWIGNGNVYGNWLAASVSPDADGLGATTTGYTNIADDPYAQGGTVTGSSGYGYTGSIRIAGIWSSPVSTLEADTGSPAGALVGLAVVPSGTDVMFSGAVGGDFSGSPAVNFSFTNSSVPEPASAALLLVGGVGVLARRRRAKARQA